MPVGLALLLLVLLVSVSSVLAAGITPGSDEADPPVLSLLHHFGDVLHQVEANYATDPDRMQLVENAIRGMLRTLDPHSSFYAASDYTELQQEQGGEYYGLGILIRPVVPGSGRVVIVEPPAPGTPAYKVGLRPGDVIFEVDGEPIDEWVYPDEVVPRIKGPKGTTVRIGVQRPGEPQPLHIDVERDAIPLYTIKHVFHLRPGLGYIRILRFGDGTGDELDEALESLDEEHLGGLILDLRNNPGGSLQESIEVADRFLKRRQVVVKTVDRRQKTKSYLAPEGRTYTYPMVVLINGHSASGSEIVAGALQDHDRALIVGETSFGKALVQTVFPLPGGRGMALTTGRYQTPSGRLIQRPFEPGFFDYFYNRGDDETEKEPGVRSQAFLTDSGRLVYGGGGIRPDVIEKIGHYTPLAALASRKNLVYDFATRLRRGGVEGQDRFKHTYEELRGTTLEGQEHLMEELSIGEHDPVLEPFRDFLREQGLDFTEEEFDESRRLLANRLQQEIFLALFGEPASARVQLEIDNQLLKATELLPMAAALIKE